MEISIKDGRGSSQEAKVDIEGRLHSFAVSSPENKHVNRKGGSWSVFFTTTPTGVGDYFFYIENTGDKSLVISNITLMCSSIDTINLNSVSGTPIFSSGVDINPTNRNLNFSTFLPAATIKKDVDITGLSNVGTLHFLRCDVANVSKTLEIHSDIILPRGSAIALEAVVGTGLITCVISLSELEDI